MNERRYTFPSSRRLGGRNTFRTIRESGVKVSRGPLVLWLSPNDARRLRLGISIGRVVGNAVIRNRIKRLLREAFRLIQHDLPCSYDLVVTVRPHTVQTLADYQRLLSALLVKAHNERSASQ